MNNRDESNKLVRAEYEKDNFKIYEFNKKAKLTYVFFSGNGLFYPATEECFTKTILEQNRYEWENLGTSFSIRKCAHRVIFLRDIYMSWYVLGINSRINSIDKLLEFIRTLVGEDEVITVGSSAGAYMAIIAAIKLNARYCFAAGPQFNISLYDNENPLINKYAFDQKRRKYFDIVELVQGTSVPIYYYFPCRCEKDIEQKRIVEGRSIRIMNLDSEKHAALPYSVQIPRLLTKSVKELDQISEKIGDRGLSKIKWLFVSEGWGGPLLALLVFNSLKKKLRRK